MNERAGIRTTIKTSNLTILTIFSVELALISIIFFLDVYKHKYIIIYEN
jgi:hypothetical protein